MVVRKLSKPSPKAPTSTPKGSPHPSKRFIPALAAPPARSDSPMAILREIAAKRLDPAHLSVDQRRGCVAIVLSRHTAPELADLFRVSVDTIRRDIKHVRATLGREAREWTLEEVLGDLVGTAEACASKAMELQDPGTAWQIKRELVRELKGLGLLGGDTKDGGIRITIEAMGEGMERARETLSRALDHAMTGEVIDTEVVRVKPDRAALPAPRTHPQAPAHDPQVEVRFEDVGGDEDEDGALDGFEDVEGDVHEG